jgi:hypothetical protein
VEAQGAEGTPPDAAERAALIELGDPDALAGRYTDRIRHLIGPHAYPEWRRLLGILLPIVVPLVTVVLVGTTYVGGGTIGESIVAGLSAGFNVAVQTLFWVTLVFAVIERTTGGTLPERSWSPDQLPQVPAPDRVGIGETGASIAANVFVMVAIVWQQVQAPIVLEGQAYPLFDPALWSSWLPWFLVVAGLEIAFSITLHGRGRWTWALALVNALLAAAFAIPAVGLLQNDMLLDPALVAQLDTMTEGTWSGVVTPIITIVVVMATAWDAIDGFRKAYRTAHPVGSSQQRADAHPAP